MNDASKQINNDTQAGMATVNRGINSLNRKGREAVSPLIKSPSDTTLYTPVIQRANKEVLSPNVLIEKFRNSEGLDKRGSNDKELMERISNFIESMRVNDDKGKTQDGDMVPSGSSGQVDLEKVPGFEEA